MKSSQNTRQGTKSNFMNLRNKKENDKKADDNL